LYVGEMGSTVMVIENMLKIYEMVGKLIQGKIMREEEEETGEERKKNKSRQSY